MRSAATTLVGLMALATALLAPAQDADLVGYGKVALTAADGAVVFTCEGEAAADRLLSKLRADFSWDRLSGGRQAELVAGLPALLREGGEALLFARRGSAVYAVAGASAAAAQARLAALGLTGTETRFIPASRHPQSLDVFDLQPISMYYLTLNVRDLAKGWQRYDRHVLQQSADYWARFGFGWAGFGPFLGMDELADGAAHTFPHDACVDLAKARGMSVMFHLGQHWAPWWLRNRYPQDMVQWDPNAISGWNPLGAMAGTYLSQSATGAAYAYSRRFTGQALDRLQTVAGDSLACYRVSGGGHPGDELGMHHMSTEFMDYDEAGQAGFRRWLRAERRLDLPGLGQRWHGDATRFTAWEQVRIPSQFEAFGGFGTGTLDLLRGWLWRPDHPDAEAQGWQTTGYTPGDEWTPTDLAPSLQQLFLFGSARDRELRQGNSTVAWFRQEFDPTPWLEQNRGRPIYLVAQVGDNQTEPVEVWFNEAYLGPIKPKTVFCGPIAFLATALVKPGRNVLCLKVRNGLIRGPVFLTTEEPRRYPYLGATGNARWLDLRDWQADKLINGWRREAGFARARLPDLPLLFCPGSCQAFADRFLGLKRDLGIACIHYTGGGSSYMPWWAGLGYVWGAYMTSEEGGTIAEPANLDRELAWMLMDGHGHHNYYYDALDYVRLDEKTGWFSRNTRLFELYGKATWQRPPVAVFRAARTDNYFPYANQADDWDIGRSSLQAAHYQNVYVTEAEIRAGLAADYPVLWDAGTPVLDDELLAALERYVRAGGTFVAVSTTGRHGLLEPDRWPIERLTGFKVLGERRNMHVTVAPGNPLLKRLAGQTFNGNGIAVNWMGVNHLEDGAVALQPEDGDGVVLATWEDGSVAAGLRRLGQGRVIVLGSSFWRSMSDRAGNGVSLNGSVQTAFFNDLFSGLGIAKQADIDSEELWVRRFTTKNGLQEWVMVYNAGRATASGRTLTFPLAQRPARVLDSVSGEPVDFAWDNAAGVRLPNLAVEPNRVRVFSVDRPDSLAAVRHWFAEKVRYGAKPAVPLAPAADDQLPLPPATAVTLDSFRFRRAEATATTDLAWLTEATEGPAWREVGYGFWDDLGGEPKGVALYRRSFDVPTAWAGRRVLLAFLSWDYPVFLEKASAYVNGLPAGDYAGHPWANFDVLDITGLVKPGSNAIGLRVEASECRGGYIGQLAVFALDKLDGVIELDTGWRLFADNRQSAPVNLPVDAEGRHLETEVSVPGAWHGRTDVVLEFESGERCLGMVVVNGRPIAYNQYAHPFANLMQVNLYPHLKPGQPNRIEFWPPVGGEMPAKRRFVVKSARLGLAK